jgi:hypothetical protein
MINFEANYKVLLPYEKELYLDYLEEDNCTISNWKGVSFQLKTKELEIGLIKFIKFYEPLFKNAVMSLDNGKKWIVNHDDKDLKWLPNDENNLKSLRTLFRQNNIQNTFTGALILNKQELLNYSLDLISYPFSVFNKNGLLYKNLDVSHSEKPIIIKISGHWNIDFLSTDINLLRKIVADNFSSNFTIHCYNGTQL